VEKKNFSVESFLFGKPQGNPWKGVSFSVETGSLPLQRFLSFFHIVFFYGFYFFQNHLFSFLKTKFPLF